MSTAILDSERTCLKPKTTRLVAFPRALLGVVLAFPLGILSALASAIGVFGSILPISVFLGLVLPIAIPLVVITGLLLAVWLILRATFALFIDLGSRLLVGLTSNLAIHAIFRACDVAYMGLYGAFVLAHLKPPEPLATPQRILRPRLFIPDMTRTMSFASLPTPPYSSPSYTPLRNSPTPSEHTDGLLSFSTTADESLLLRLSEMMHALDNEELEVFASYVTTLRDGRKNLRWE